MIHVIRAGVIPLYFCIKSKKMKIHIDNQISTKEIKEKFSLTYPFLKLEFFKTAHQEGEGSGKADLINEDASINDIRKPDTEGDFVFTPENTVTELEQGFETKFGIHVQVFRKSKSLWLETTTTDNWSLKEQNETGKEMES